MAAHRIGVCRQNVRRVSQARQGVEMAQEGLTTAYTAWTNRTQCPDETSLSMGRATDALDDLRRQLVGDERVWHGHLLDAATEMEAKRAATVAKKVRA